MIKRVTADDTSTVAPADGPPNRAELIAQAEGLYETYVKPLETEHWGEYVAVSRDGRVVLGADLEDVSKEAAEAFGRGNFLFKVGEVAVGTIR